MGLSASFEAGTFAPFYIFTKAELLLRWSIWLSNYHYFSKSHKQQANKPQCCTQRYWQPKKRWAAPSAPLHITVPEIPACAQHRCLGSQTQVRAMGKSPEVGSDALGWSKQVPHFSFYDLYTGALEVFPSFTPFFPATLEAIAMMIFFFFLSQSQTNRWKWTRRKRFSARGTDWDCV